MEQNNKKDNGADNNNKSLLYAGIAIIVVIAIALIVPHLHKSTAAPVPTTPAPVTTTTTTQTPETAAASLAAWNAMYQKYDGKLVVFAEDCTSTPVTQTQTKGTTVLLMNNSNVAHTVTVGTNVYKIGALHYKTTMLNTKGTIAVGCDASTDSTNIVVD